MNPPCLHAFLGSFLEHIAADRYQTYLGRISVDRPLRRACCKQLSQISEKKEGLKREIEERESESGKSTMTYRARKYSGKTF